MIIITFQLFLFFIHFSDVYIFSEKSNKFSVTPVLVFFCFYSVSFPLLWITDTLLSIIYLLDTIMHCLEPANVNSGQ